MDNQQFATQTKLPLIITLGEPAGIGPEIIVKAIENSLTPSIGDRMPFV